MQIAIVNGPNLNLLGKREVDIYGNQSFDDFFETLKSLFPALELSYFQSNSEGELISYIQDKGFTLDGVVLNAAGYSHTSVSLADAVAAVPAPVVEVHISNIFAREDFRHHSYLSTVCDGVLSGFGLDGYRMAISYLSHLK